MSADLPHPLHLALSELRKGVSERTHPLEVLAYIGERLELNWCAAFVLWCIENAGREYPGNRYRNRAVWHFQREMERAGWLAEEPRPGDIFVARRRGGSSTHRLLDEKAPGHIGWVWRASKDSPGFVSVEGNVADRIMSREWMLPHPVILAFYRVPGAAYVPRRIS